MPPFLKGVDPEGPGPEGAGSLRWLPAGPRLLQAAREGPGLWGRSPKEPAAAACHGLAPGHCAQRYLTWEGRQLKGDEAKVTSNPQSEIF